MRLIYPVDNRYIRSERYFRMSIRLFRQADVDQHYLSAMKIGLVNYCLLVGTLKATELVLAASLIFLIITQVIMFRRKRRLEKAKEVEIRDLLQERDVLTNELHHRVKNNLHIIGSLLNSQARFLSNDALNAIKQSQHRVQTISLLYQKYYLDGGKTSIDMSLYLSDLVNYLWDDFAAARSINFRLDVDDIRLELSKAVSIGLIVNEVVTNSIVHAFPDGHNCAVEIFFKKYEDHYLLMMRDNGKGLPPGFDHQHTQTLGMMLINGLAEEVDADVSISNCSGTQVRLVIPALSALARL